MSHPYRHLRPVPDGDDAPPLPAADADQEEPVAQHSRVAVRDHTQPPAATDGIVEPTRIWAPGRTVDLVVRRVENFRAERGGVLRVAARATRSSTTYGAIGLGRTAGAWWRWVMASELDQNLAARPEMVLGERKRRRQITLWTAGGGAVGDLVASTTMHLPLWALPAGLVAAVAAVGGVIEWMVRRSKTDETGEQGRKNLGIHPGSKSVRRAVADAKLGRFEDIRILAPGVHRLPPTSTAPGAWSCIVELPAGTPAATAEKKRLELASAIGGVGLAQVAVDPIRGNASRFELWVADSDPLAGDSISSPLVGRTEPFDVWRDKVAVGVDVRGRPIGFRLPERSILTGGEPGAGKSVACNNVLCSVALDPRMPMWLIDGKGGADLMDYEPIAERFLGEPDPEAMLAMVSDLQDLMSDRYRRLKAIGARKVTPEIAEETGMHPLFFHIDELQAFTADPDLGRKITYGLWDIVSRGRASLVIMSGATQRPAPEVVPSKLGAILSVRWAMRCTDDKSSDTILGKGWAGRGFNAGLLDPIQRGAGFLLAESSVPSSMRTYFLSDNDVEVLARRAYKLREAAGTLPVGENSPEVLLLKACVAACGEAEKIWTADLLPRVAADPAFADLADDPGELARRLRPHGLAPKGQDIDGTNRNGYRRAEFVEALNGLQRR